MSHKEALAYLVDHDNHLQNLVENSQEKSIGGFFLHSFTVPVVRFEFRVLATIFKMKLLGSAESV